MSLQLAAQHLSSQGRGKDSTLVHMSPREVKGLNDLAMAHGGQLSINPQTGLPEAGFLESILPMVAGAALTATGVGAPMAALMVGGGMTLMTGSLQKGLMAGLGAYGGANLGSGLLASGTDAAVASAPEVAAAQQNAATQMQNFYDPAAQAFKPGGLEAVQKASMDASTAQAAARNLAAPDFMGKLQAMGKGIGTLGQEGGFSSLYQNLGGSPMSLLKSVGSAAAPAIGEMMTPKKEEETKGDSDLGQRYGFSMNPTGGQSRSLGVVSHNKPSRGKTRWLIHRRLLLHHSQLQTYMVENSGTLRLHIQNSHLKTLKKCMGMLMAELQQTQIALLKRQHCKRLNKCKHNVRLNLQCRRLMQMQSLPSTLNKQSVRPIKCKRLLRHPPHRQAWVSTVTPLTLLNNNYLEFRVLRQPSQPTLQQILLALKTVL